MIKHYYGHYTKNNENGKDDGLKVIPFKKTYIHYEKRFGNTQHHEQAYGRIGGRNERMAFESTFAN